MGIEYCNERSLYSAGELKSSIIYLKELQKDNAKSKTPVIKLPIKYRGDNPEIRDLSIYEDAMEKGCN